MDSSKWGLATAVGRRWQNESEFAGLDDRRHPLRGGLYRFFRDAALFAQRRRFSGRQPLRRAYLICTAVDATGASITNTLIALEMFSKTGFSLQFWNNFTGFITFMLALAGDHHLPLSSNPRPAPSTSFSRCATARACGSLPAS